MVSSMTCNQVVYTMFDFNTCNHMVRFILLGDGIKDPESHLFDPGCDGICIIYWHIDPLCMSRGYVIFIWNFLHGSIVYSWWLCDILTVWIHGVWLVAMTYVHDVTSIWSEYGNAYLRIWYIWYSTDAWMFAGLRLDVLLVLDTHMQLTKSIDCHWFRSQTLGGILFSTFLVIGMMSWQCHDNRKSNSLLRTFSWGRLHLSVSRKHSLKDSSQAAYILTCGNP